MESYIEAAIIATLCENGVIPKISFNRGGFINYQDTDDIWRAALDVLKPKVLINAIKTIDRDKVENNFWDYQEDMDMNGLFDYMTGEEISDEFDSAFERVKAEMINELKKI